MLFRAISTFFPVMLQNNVVIGPQRTARRVPQKAEAEKLFATDSGRRHFPFRRGCGHAVPRLAAGHFADCGRPFRKRRPAADPDAGANLCARRKSGSAITDHDRRGERKHRAVRGLKDRPRRGAGRPELAGQCRIRRHRAQERRCPVGTFRPSGQRFKKTTGPKNQGDRRSRRTSRRPHRPNPGQCHVAERDPDRIRR